MQPFDAVTMQAVVQEAKPLLLNRRVSEINQLGRDEVVIAFRNKAGQTELLLSAHAVYGRICLTKTDTRRRPLEKLAEKSSDRPSDRSQEHRSGFLTLLRKHLTGATLVGVDQAMAERVVDFVFSCVDEVGGTSLKVLTAEIMGRHGNLIFWNHADKAIIASSHFVTKDMSRHREVLIGLPYVRPPVQEKPSAFAITLEELKACFEEWMNVEKPEAGSPDSDQIPVPLGELRLESFLLAKYAGLGRQLAREIVRAALLQETDNDDSPSMPEKIFSVLSCIREMNAFKPAIKRDLSCYTIFSFTSEQRDTDIWKPLPAVNDLVDEYYRSLSMLETYNQTRERMLSEARSEVANFESRLKAASDLVDGDTVIDRAKCYGDLILSNLHDINPGQNTFECTNFYADPPDLVSISLQPNLSAVQNAQLYYRQFAKARSRQSSAKLAWEEAQVRLLRAQTNLAAITSARNIEELNAFKRETFTLKPPPKVSATQSGSRQKPKTKLLTLTSADGWTIYVGRNRHENDYLLTRVAQPNDIWFHILGQSGAHVVVKVPSAKREPPLSTVKEAALTAARFSKTAPGTKVRIVYTHCRNIKKAGSSKPGVVRYENEKTLEVDTSDSLVACKEKVR